MIVEAGCLRGGDEKMQRVPLESSTIATIAYDPEQRVLDTATGMKVKSVYRNTPPIALPRIMSSKCA
jgi:hypothetical protein